MERARVHRRTSSGLLARREALPSHCYGGKHGQKQYGGRVRGPDLASRQTDAEPATVRINSHDARGGALPSAYRRLRPHTLSPPCPLRDRLPCRHEEPPCHPIAGRSPFHQDLRRRGTVAALRLAGGCV